MRDEPLGRSQTGWRSWPRTRTGVVASGVRAAVSITAGCAAALAVVVVPVQAAPASPAGTITTLAGGVGRPALATALAFESLDGCATVNVADGQVYLGDLSDSVVRAINPRTDAVTTPAGIGQAGFDGDQVPAANTELNEPCAATVDGAGNLVIADEGNARVRVVAAKSGTFYGQHMVAGDIYTIDNGGGTCIISHQPGSSFCPADVITDGNGNILVSNAGTRQLGARSVAQIVALPERSGTFYGKKMVAGKKYVLAKGGGFQIAVDHAGNILMAQDTTVKVLAEKTGRFYGLAMKRGRTYVVAGNGMAKPTGNGGPARKAGLNTVLSVAVDHLGNVVLGAPFVGTIRVVAVKSGTFYGKRMVAGHIYQIAGVRKGLTGDGVPAAKANVGEPFSIAVDGQGNVVFTDGLFTVRAIAERTGTFYGRPMKTGDVYTVAGNASGLPYAGDGGPATSAQDVTGGIAVDAAGNLLIANGVVRVVAAATATFYGQAMTKGHIYPIAGNGERDTGGTGVGDGGPASEAKLSAADVAVDAHGNLVVTDLGGQRIRVVADRTGSFYGQSMTAGDIYTVAGSGAGGFAGDGGPAVAAKINDPEGVAIDAAGNLIFINGIDDGRVRVVAATTGTFYHQSMTAGDIYTVAGCQCDPKNLGDGGPALSATFEFTDFEGDQVAIDEAGNLVVADPGDGLIRVIAESTGRFYGQAMTAGDVYAVAGDGVDTGTFANGVPATSSGLFFVTGVTVDGNGNLIIGDTDNEEVRVVAATTGTFYGISMTAGDIYALAGDHHVGLSPDGGPISSSLVCRPSWVTVSHGNVIFSDFCNSRIREIQSGP
jgi:hypothetical protein